MFYNIFKKTCSRGIYNNTIKLFIVLFYPILCRLCKKFHVVYIVYLCIVFSTINRFFHLFHTYNGFYMRG